MNNLHIKGHPLAGGILCLALGLSLGCGPGEVTTVGETDSGASSTAAPSTGTSAAGPTTGSETEETESTQTQTTESSETDASSETDPLTDSDATAGTDTGTDTDTDTGGIDCPQPEDVSVEFLLMPEVDEVDQDCLVAGAEEMGDAFTIDLTCGLETYTVWFSSPSLELPGGVAPASEVHLAYASSPGELGPNRWLALQVGDLNRSVLGGVSAETLNPPGTTFSEFFVDPVVTVVNNVCDPIDMRCGPVERVGLRFMGSQSEATIFDQGVGAYSGDFVSSSIAAVAQAVLQLENSCEQGSATWFEFGWSWVYFGP